MNVAPPMRPGQPAETLVAFAAMTFAGLFFPDIDQQLRLHRWIVTHSALPVLLFLTIRPLRSPALAAGFALGIAAHLAADLFPHGMRGTALIKLWPGEGTGRLFTYVWLGLNLYVCAWIADRAAHDIHGHRGRVILLGSALALAAAYVVLNGEAILTMLAMGGGFVAAQGTRVARTLFRRP